MPLYLGTQTLTLYQGSTPLTDVLVGSQTIGGSGVVGAPTGFSYLLDFDNARFTDDDGAILMEVE